MGNNIQQQTLVRIFTDTLAAGANKIYQVGIGDHLFLYANNGTANTLGFSFDQTAEQRLLVGQVVTTQGDPNNPAQLLKFSTVQIINNDSASCTYTIVVSNGAIDFKGLVISSTITTMTQQSSTGVFAADIATGAAAKVFTGIANYGITLQADRANTAPVYIGFNNTVSATKKFVALEPGAVYIFDKFKGDIYAFSTAAQTLSVGYMT